MSAVEQALWISVVGLWIAVAGLAAVVVALVRQVGVLHERIAPAGALVLRRGPSVGEPAPLLALETLEGRSLVPGAPREDGRSTLLFFLSPSCPVCSSLLPALRSLSTRERDRLEVVLASDGPPEEHERFRRERDLGRFPYLLSAELGRAFQVGQLPFAVLIDDKGVLRAQGLVNTREHLDSLLEAQNSGVGSLQELLSGERRRAGGGSR